jgi:Flp pilus assembly protein TadG
MKSIKNIRSPFRHLVRSERGSQLVELSFAVPFLLLMFAGTAEIGRLFYTYTTLAKATKVGARYLSTVQADGSGNFTAADLNAAKNLVLCGNAGGCGGSNPAPVVSGLTAGNISVTNPGTALGARYVTVTITGVTYQPAVFDLGAMTGNRVTLNNISLNPSTRMRYMRS